MTHFKKFGNKIEEERKEDEGCSFVQYGNNLSQLNSPSTTVVMNVNIKKNKFFFTDKERASKNVLLKNVKLEPTVNYNVYVSSLGEVTINLLHVEETSKN